MMERLMTSKEHESFFRKYVLSGKMILFNNTTNQQLDVNEENVKDISNMMYEMSKGHGIGHLECIVR
tara:strand:+ start:1066 stop:1266 length:201 start_codon:yes stop_codon:yes gene_type:complete